MNCFTLASTQGTYDEALRMYEKALSAIGEIRYDHLTVDVDKKFYSCCWIQQHGYVIYKKMYEGSRGSN